MIKFITAFFLGLVILLLVILYFMGQYHLNPDYLLNKINGKDEVVRELVLDKGVKDTTFYQLKINSKGEVEYGTSVRHQSKRMTLSPQEVEKVNSLIGSSGVFKLVDLNRTYCFSHYQATLTLDLGWIGKKTDYVNCNDDPEEIKLFRQELYEMLEIDLPKPGN